MNEFLSTVAPTVASALLGPLGGIAITGLGKIFGIDNATQKDITKMISEGQVTPDQLAAIKKLELRFQADELERGFRFKELEFKDTDSARQMQMATKSSTPTVLTWIVVGLTLIFEGMVLFGATPADLDKIVLGRVMGTLDAALMLVLGFWFGSSHGSQNKDILLSQSQPSKPE